jgi:hypothetical protein
MEPVDVPAGLELLPRLYAQHYLSRTTAASDFIAEVPPSLCRSVLHKLYMSLDSSLTPSTLDEALATLEQERKQFRSGWSCLHGDELAFIFALLSFEERKAASLVCRHWRKYAFKVRDPRCFRTQHALQMASRDEVTAFLRRTPGITAFGRCDVKRFLAEPSLVAHTVQRLAISLKGCALSDVQAVLRLPHLLDLSLYMSSAGEQQLTQCALEHIDVRLVKLRRLQLVREGSPAVRRLVSSGGLRIPPSVTELLLQDAVRALDDALGGGIFLPAGLESLCLELNSQTLTKGAITARLPLLLRLQIDIEQPIWGQPTCLPADVVAELLDAFPTVCELVGPLDGLTH